ncbi:MAG TPA: pitrilysin family protein [Candidatus Binatia bacterium]|nr:pitrilysin family protein [Candidatus Binatia bacterium]
MRLRSLFAAILGLTLIPGLATAETIRRETLPNGMRLVLVENHSKPLVAACIFVNGGSRTETPALSGLSHYYEHLIFRGGSLRQGELEFRKQMQRIGEETGGYTTNDYTCYGFTAPKENFDEAVDRSVDAWMNLKLTQEKVNKERQVVMSEYNQGEDRPDYKVYYQIERLMFRDHPYKRDTIGLKDVIEHATLATFKTFYDDRYVPNQMVLAVVGDFDAAQVKAKLAKAFGAYKRGRDDFEQGLTEKPQVEFRMGVESMKTPSTWTYVGFHVPTYSDPDAPALTVLASLLGEGNSSRLYKALKERENLVTTVDAQFEVRRDPGMLFVSCELPPQNEARVFGLIRDELKKLATGPVPPAELERVKSGLENKYAFASERFFSRAERLCLFGVMSDASLEPLWPSLIGSVSAEDLQRVARTYLAADLASYSVVRPAGTTGPSQSDITAMLAPWREGWPAQSVLSATAGLKKETLPNGVTLLLKEDHSTPVVAVSTMARGGQWIDPEGLAGVSNMAAEMLRRGAGSMSAREISERADALGMTLESEGTSDAAMVTWQAPSKNFAKAWDIFRDVVTQPTFPAGEVAKVREDLMQQARSLGDRPFDYTNVQFQRALYTRSPYRNPVAGDTATLFKIQVADLRHAYEKMFSGKNLVIAIVGDFDAASTLELARRSLGRLRAGSPVVMEAPRDEAPRESRVVFVNKDQEQVTYNTGWPACTLHDADYVPLKMAVNLIGDRVFFKYVYEKGVAYRSWFYMADRFGQMSAQNEMGVTPAHFPMVSAGVLEDVARVTREGVTAADLQGIIQKTLSRYYLGAQDDASQAGRLSFYEASGLGYEFAERYPEMIRRVTAEQLTAAARKYFAPGRYTRVAVGKEEAAAGGKASPSAPSR